MEFGIIEGILPCGLFGGTLTWILEILPYLKKNNIYPMWNINAIYYGNIVPNIIKPKIINSTITNKIDLLELKKLYSYKFTKDEFINAHNIFFEYFDICDDILNTVHAIQQKFGKKSLGIHYRGTDKSIESEFISIEDVIKNMNNFLLLYPDIDTLFIASDEEIFINKIQNEFLNKNYILIFTNSFRSNNSIPIHFINTININKAREAMVDSLLLSKCNYVIKTSSCLSDWVKIWNPYIEIYNLNKFFYDWFPQAAIPVKSFL